MDNPTIEERDGTYQLIINGEPFIILGGQIFNSSAWPVVLDDLWPRFEELSFNTIEVPIYWEAIEPKQGEYDFSNANYLIEKATDHNLKLIFLWFATWKNGRMTYAPEWIKENSSTYTRVVDEKGEKQNILSPHCDATLEADKKAFHSLLDHIKDIDDNQTVIMVQPENEPGLLDTVRDHSAEATEDFESEVPDELIDALNVKEGTWQEVFGNDAEEVFTAYHVASYIDEVASAGKEAYSLPMYVNAWIREQRFQRPEEYPTGGPTSNVLDVWKAAAPHIDFLAPDLYIGNDEKFSQICDAYDRNDNPLFIPEMGRGMGYARKLISAIGNQHALGVAPYGIDRQDPTKRVDPSFEHIEPQIETFRLLEPVLPVIATLRGTDHLKAATERPGLTDELLQFDKYDLLLTFQETAAAFSLDENKDATGRVIVARLGPDEFLITGFDTQFEFRTPQESDATAEVLSVKEGTYDGKGTWHTERRWNGDALHYSQLPNDGATIRMKLQYRN